jgi:hypothetical protein
MVLQHTIRHITWDLEILESQNSMKFSLSAILGWVSSERQNSL